jgi:hypothetical protein
MGKNTRAFGAFSQDSNANYMFKCHFSSWKQIKGLLRKNTSLRINKGQWKCNIYSKKKVFWDQRDGTLRFLTSTFPLWKCLKWDLRNQISFNLYVLGPLEWTIVEHVYVFRCILYVSDKLLYTSWKCKSFHSHPSNYKCLASAIYM